jgi:hypothetical protein
METDTEPATQNRFLTAQGGCSDARKYARRSAQALTPLADERVTILSRKEVTMTIFLATITVVAALVVVLLVARNRSV